MYRVGEVSIHRACCERATQPYSLGGGGRFDKAQDQQVITTPCFLAKDKNDISDKQFQQFPPKLGYSCRAKPVKKVGPRRKLTKQEWDLASSVPLP